MTISNPDGTRKTDLPERKTVAIDFDCIHPKAMWVDGIPTGEPEEGALEVIEEFRRWYDVVIVTAWSLGPVKDWVGQKLGVPSYSWITALDTPQMINAVRITARMPPCIAYISRRAIRFEGWTKRAMKEFQPDED